jgi:hypothetical protein
VGILVESNQCTAGRCLARLGLGSRWPMPWPHAC